MLGLDVFFQLLFLDMHRLKLFVLVEDLAHAIVVVVSVQAQAYIIQRVLTLAMDGGRGVALC